METLTPEAQNEYEGRLLSRLNALLKKHDPVTYLGWLEKMDARDPRWDIGPVRIRLACRMTVAVFSTVLPRLPELHACDNPVDDIILGTDRAAKVFRRNERLLMRLMHKSVALRPEACPYCGYDTKRDTLRCDICRRYL